MTSPAAKRLARRRALIEATANTAAGFLLSVVAWIIASAPVISLYLAAVPGAKLTDPAVAVGTTAFYTALSLGRNYLIRVFFARLWQ